MPSRADIWSYMPLMWTPAEPHDHRLSQPETLISGSLRACYSNLHAQGVTYSPGLCKRLVWPRLSMAPGAWAGLGLFRCDISAPNTAHLLVFFASGIPQDQRWLRVLLGNACTGDSKLFHKSFKIHVVPMSITRD